MKTLKLLLVGSAFAVARIAAADPPPPSPPAAPTLAELHAACDADIQKLCGGIQPGGGRILACLKQNKDVVSPTCKQAIVKAVQAAPAGPS